MPPLINVNYPKSYQPERNYIYKLILEEWLGLKAEYKCDGVSESTSFEIADESSNCTLTIADSLFSTPFDKWLSVDTIPATVGRVSSYIADKLQISNEIPLLYFTGDEVTLNERNSGKWFFSGDIFGSCFFMLTRYEEIAVRTRDTHGRFPFTASSAAAFGFINLPIVDLYVKLLRNLFLMVWPQLTFVTSKYSVTISHDVDHPFRDFGRSRKAVLASVSSDIIKRVNLKSAINRIMTGILLVKERDIYYTYDYLMDSCDHYGIISEFNFMVDCGNYPFGSEYDIRNPSIITLMRHIVDRGHRLGLHAGYASLGDKKRLTDEYAKLQNVLSEAQIPLTVLGGRHHYLRFENPDSWQAWNESGLTYDSTVGYTEQVGFRCGTGFEYPVFNLLTRKELPLRERPLVIMESTFLREVLNGHETLGGFLNAIVANARIAGSQINLLWHNSSLRSLQERSLFEDTLRLLLDESDLILPPSYTITPIRCHE